MRANLFLSLLLVVGAVAPSVGAAPPEPTASVAKEKATVATLTARRDRLIKARDELRALAAQAPAGKLNAEETKARARFIAKVKETADGVHALAEKITAGLAAKQDIDALSEMSESEALRLQMAMDAESKMLATLSNLCKKESDTASQIVGNMK